MHNNPLFYWGKKKQVTHVIGHIYLFIFIYFYFFVYTRVCVGERERERERDLVIKSNEGEIFINKNPSYLKDSYLWNLCKEVVDHSQKLQYETCGSFNFYEYINFVGLKMYFRCYKSILYSLLAKNKNKNKKKLNK
jgi:hypothetical protein